MTTAQEPDDNIAYRIWVGTIVTIVPATLVVALRVAARLVSRVGLWWDDYTIMVSLVINWGMAATRWSEVLLYDYGRHAQYLPKYKVQHFQISFIAVQFTYFTNAVFTKTSLLLLFHRVFGVVRGFRWALWISGFLIMGYFIACAIVAVAGCDPVSYFWNKDQSGSCINEVNFFRWNGIVNMLLDVLVLCLPLPMTWRMKMSLRQKFIVTGIFCLGGFVCVVSILRIVTFDSSSTDDPTYTSINSATWSSVEQSVAIICACLPTLRPLFRNLYGGSQQNHTLDKSSGSDTNAHSTPIRLSEFEPQRDPYGSTASITRTTTNATASRESGPGKHAAAGGTSYTGSDVDSPLYERV